VDREHAESASGLHASKEPRAGESRELTRCQELRQVAPHCIFCPIRTASRLVGQGTVPRLWVWPVAGPHREGGSLEML